MLCMIAIIRWVRCYTDYKYKLNRCTMYSVHCTLYTVHCTLYSVYCTLYSLQCTVYTTLGVIDLRLHIYIDCI